MNETKPNPNPTKSASAPAPLPNLQARANALREQEVLELVMKVRSQIGHYYQQIIWMVIERDRVTREQIADAFGVTDRAIRNWVQGQSAPRIQEQAVLMALDSGLLVVKLLPDRTGHVRPVLVLGVLAGGGAAGVAVNSAATNLAGQILDKS